MFFIIRVQGHKLTALRVLSCGLVRLPTVTSPSSCFNRGNSSANLTISWSEHLGMNPQTTVSVRDLVLHKDLGSFSSSFSSTVGRHASQTLRLSMTSPVKGKRMGVSVARKYKSINEVYDEHPGMVAVLGGRRMQ